ncbi:MAG: hypothetical protein IJM59_13245 [Proteobacteria bacterium]|nr:hypothetical protein [Pseudomonadota bacterium]
MRIEKWLLCIAVVSAGCSNDAEETGQKGQDTAPQPGNCIHECANYETRCDGFDIVACETDSQTGCRIWGKAASCGTGKHCSGDKCVDGCVDKCTEGDVVCEGALIKTCIRNEDQCTDWSAAESCGEDKHCEGNVCVDKCADECTQDAFECAGNDYRICNNFDTDTCLEWGVNTCPTGTICDAKQRRCIEEECADSCDLGTARCNSDKTGIVICNGMDENQCPIYINDKTCPEGTICVDDGDDVECKADCHDECTLNDKKCSDDLSSLLTCVEQDGCLGWKSTSCSSKEICNVTTAKCDDTCHQCDAGQTRCSDDGKNVESCLTREDDCTYWVKSEKCESSGEAKSCKNGKCVYNCGDPNSKSCEPFTIILVPDTQDYTGLLTSNCAGYYYNDWGSKKNTWNNSFPGIEMVNPKDSNGKPAKDTSGNTLRYYPASAEPPKTTLYHKEMEWIKNRYQKGDFKNLKMVAHLGDITDNNQDFQWKIAKAAHKYLLDAKIPFSLVNGNHDYQKFSCNNHTKDNVGTGKRTQSLFTKYFDENYLKKLPGYGGNYQGHNTYFNFEAGGQKFLLLSLEYAPRNEVVCWANDLLNAEENRDKKVIVVSHGIIKRPTKTGEYINGPDTRLEGIYIPNRPIPAEARPGSTGAELGAYLLRRHSNIVFSACGHVSSDNRLSEKGYNGNTLYHFLVDYQREGPCNENTTKCSNNCTDIAGHGGNGWVKVLELDPKDNTITLSSRTLFEDEPAEVKSTVFSKDGKPKFHCSEIWDKNNSYNTNNSDLYFYASDTKYHKYTEGVSESDIGYVNNKVKVDFTFSHLNQYKEEKSDNKTYKFIPFIVDDLNVNNRTAPRVAVRPNGGFVIVWSEKSPTSSYSTDIHAQVFRPYGCADPNGAGEGKQFVVNKTTKGPQYEPDVAMDKDGNFVVVWTDDKEADGNYEILMRAYNADGSPKWDTSKTVNTKNKEGQQTEPRIAMASDGTYVISWTSTHLKDANDDEVSRIMIRGYHADGTELFAERLVFDDETSIKANSSQVHSDIFMDDSHRIVVTWEDDIDGNKAKDVHVRFLNPDGTNKTKIKNVNDTSSGDQTTPAVSGKRDGSKIVITWADNDWTTKAIKAASFDGNGNSVDSPMMVSTMKKTNYIQPTVCINESGHTSFVWYDASAGNIMRRLAYDLNGKLDWPQVSSSDKTLIAEKRTNSPDNAASEKNGQSNEPHIGCIPGTNTAVLTYADDWAKTGHYDIFVAPITLTTKKY